MKYLQIITFIFSFLLTNKSFAKGDPDPFSSIEYITLDNGIQVFLAPSATARLVKFNVTVDVGYNTEKKGLFGVSHLLEHVLFRSKELKDDMSYLQLIKEAGGNANGTTKQRETSYYGWIGKEKGDWLMDQFFKIVTQAEITDRYVENEKKTVLLEIGKPGPITSILGFDPVEALYPSYLRPDTFWKSEFGMDFENNFSVAEEQITTMKLSREQVQKHYNDYYRPENMKIFVAGSFNKTKVLKKIKSTWGKISKRLGKKIPPMGKPNPSKSPYKRVSISNEDSDITLGYKLWGLSYPEEEVFSAYFKYLSHRLMKSIRNKNGEAYTVQKNSSFYEGYGYSLVYLRTPREVYSKNYNLVKSLLKNEVEMGGLTEEQVKEAKEIYLNQYKLAARDAHSMMHFAQRSSTILSNYGVHSSPLKVLKNISTGKFNNILKKHSGSSKRYSSITRPSFFFRYDQFFFSIFCFMGVFFFFKTGLMKPFYNEKVNWIRKVKFPPLKALEMGLGIIGISLFLHFELILRKTLFVSSFMNSSILFSSYFRDFISILSMIGVAQVLVSLYVRKLYIMDSKLVMKSLSYFSRHIPIEEIKTVSLSSPTRILFKGQFIKKFWFNFSFYHFKFWKKGVLVELKNGDMYFFGFKNPEAVNEELNGFLPQSLEAGSSESLKEAA